MGYQTTVIILNDHLNDLTNPQFGKQLRDDIMSWWNGKDTMKRRTEYTIVAQDHADYHHLMVVGNYRGVTLAGTHDATNTEEHKMAMNIRLLREAADKLGFKLIRKPARGRR